MLAHGLTNAGIAVGLAIDRRLMEATCVKARVLYVLTTFMNATKYNHPYLLLLFNIEPCNLV